MKAGDELFLSYGACYERSYPVNMSCDKGCGCFKEASGYLKPNIDRLTYEKVVETFGYVPKTILSDESKHDKRVVEFFENVRPPSGK